MLVSALAWSGAVQSAPHAAAPGRAGPRGVPGLRERAGPLDKRGLHLTFWNTDCFPHHTDTDPLYVSVPFTR
ncbi:hypothetical protein LAJ19_11820 [Deinococcus taeanensis]|uniref:hypothetical protein n=1 Tax=Deinococcus taeanensis TaxID=2737050 RepID=UPI001CDC4E29|nr:hypothetical protein [Deinococcus taeanensis]UBV42304.1 hypothetical protein LAJ19_11820 [Deinococcus taeanensis]